VLAGPRFSPPGRLVTEVITPAHYLSTKTSPSAEARVRVTLPAADRDTAAADVGLGPRGGGGATRSGLSVPSKSRTMLRMRPLLAPPSSAPV
jgi:hypothetical protein